MFLVPVNTVDMVVVFPLAMFIHFFWDSWMANPEFQTVINTTLVLLENTEVVWRPVLTVSLVLAKPVLELALILMKPILHALVLVAPIVKNLALQTMNLTANLLMTIRELGIDIRSSVSNLALSLQSFGGAMFTITKAASNMLYYSVQSISYVVSSFESVGDFSYRLLFETRTVSWSDVESVVAPFLVVASILGYVAWRAYSTSYTYTPPPQTQICDYTVYPRRSSRIARKRALMLLNDLPPDLASRELSALASASPPNL